MYFTVRGDRNAIPNGDQKLFPMKVRPRDDEPDWRNYIFKTEVNEMAVPKEVRDHVKHHVNYPATKEELVNSCNMMSDVSASDKKWFEKTLPEGTYRTTRQVMKFLS
jgi:hypothetical protein